MKSIRLSLPHALAWIVGSVFLVNGLAYNALKFYFKAQRAKTQDRHYAIAAIVQTGPQKEALKTDYLAELIGLSVDRPVSCLNFDVKKAEKRLMGSPLIKEAHVKTVPPTGIYVDYSIRQPIAWIYDFENIAVDQEGFLFPITPFLTPKILPEIYFGMGPFGQASEGDLPTASFGQPLKGKYVDIALSLLKMLSTVKGDDPLEVRRIDVSDAFASSYGQRQIVLNLEDSFTLSEGGRSVSFILPRILRLSTKTYAQELGNFLNLREGMLSQERAQLKMPADLAEKVRLPDKVIDFRIAGLAFIDEKQQ